ncbi:hypothetical protein ACLOJK_016408 [Asimina triloba]
MKTMTQIRKKGESQREEEEEKSVEGEEIGEEKTVWEEIGGGEIDLGSNQRRRNQSYDWQLDEATIRGGDWRRRTVGPEEENGGENWWGRMEMVTGSLGDIV